MTVKDKVFVTVLLCVIYAVCTAVVLGALLGTPAHGQVLGHGHDDFWINQDKYKSPSAGGVYVGAHCCGEKDCFSVREGVDFRADGDAWLFLEGQVSRAIENVWGLNIVGMRWPRALDQTYNSEDALNWVCVGQLGIRCFFRDQGGF